MAPQQETSTYIVSPDKLNELVKIIDSKAWLALIGLFLVIGFFIAWMFLAKIDTRVQAKGMLFQVGGISSIISGASGRITELNIKVGDTVKAGQVVGLISQTDLLNDIEAIKADIEEQKNQNKEEGLLRALLLKKYTRRLNDLQSRLNIMNQYIESGVVVEQQLIDLRASITETENNIENLDIQAIEQKKKLSKLERDLYFLQDKHKRNSEIKSRINGTIIEVKSSRGNVISPGDEIASVEPSQKQTDGQLPLTLILYVSLLDGKKINQDMQIKITPSNVKKEEYGYLKGKVVTVSNYPATYNAMMRDLQNDTLVNDILNSGPQINVTGQLIPDPNTVSGYKWTTELGPPITLQSGTLVEAEIVTDVKKPIDLIMPKIRDFLGLMDD